MRAIKIKTRNFAILFFSLILTLAVFSQIKAARSKPTSDVGFDKQGWFYSKTSNDLTAYLGKKGSNIPTVRYQKNEHFLEFSMSQVGGGLTATTTAVSLETNSKEPNTPTLFYRNIAEDIDAAYKITNLPFQVKEEIVLKKNPKSEIRNTKQIQNPNDQNSKQENTTFLFNSSTNAIPIKQKDGSIYFYDNQNNYLFQIDKPFMIDGKGNRSEEVTIEINPKHEARNTKQIQNPNDQNSKHFKFRISGFDIRISDFVKNLFRISDFGFRASKPEIFQQYTIILSADAEWLSQASYPVIIDPTITHNADANFLGEKNRIADADSTSSTQLESSYPEATLNPYTVLLLHFNEANGSTSGIKDYASTTRVITANGNASTTSYVTQLGLGNSAAFDGTGDYLSVPDDTSLDFAAADNFSVDFWFRHATIATNPDYAITKADTTTGGYKIYMDASGDMCFDIDDDATWTPDDSACTSAIDYDNDAWHHVAAVKTGTTKIELFVDGVSIASDSAIASTGTLANTNGFYVGMDRDGSSNGWEGYIDEVRVVNRTLTPEEIKAAASRRPYAVYTSPVLDASASVQWDTLNWTEGGVRTGDGETLYNSNSLVAQWNFNETSVTTADNAEGTAALDGTLNGFAYTASQDEATTTTGWTANNKKWGAGALMFDGTNDYVSVGDNAAWDFGSGDFTIEFWAKLSNTNNQYLISHHDGGVSDSWYIMYLSNELYFGHYPGGSGQSVSAAWNAQTGVWYHVAVSVLNSQMSLFLNGKLLKAPVNISAISTANIPLGIGGDNDGNASMYTGILDSVRIYKGRALSAAEILSNYNAGNIEIQTRTGATSDPNDGSWEAWKPTTGETQLLSMDSDAVNWHSDIMASTTIATSTDTVIKAEGTGSLKVEMGKASTTAGTVALWRFEETGTSTGTYLYDETANNNDATTTGTTVVDGIFGKARKFNGTSDYVTMLALTGGTAVTSVDFWVYPLTTTEYFVDLNGSAYVWANAGTVTATGFTSPTIYVNGAVSSAIVAGKWQHIAITTGTGINASAPNIGKTPTNNYLEGNIDEIKISNRVLSPDEIAETYRMGANHHLTRQISSTDLSGANKLPFYVAADRPGTYLEAMIGESDFANYELASSTLALSTTTVLYIKGDEIASSTSIKDSSFSGKTITANGDAKIAGGGKIGNSVSFDGTGDYLSVPDSDDFTFGSGDFSIDFWVKRAGGVGSSQTIFGQSNSGANYTPAMGQFTAANNFWVAFYAGTTQYSITSTRTITDTTTWHHIVVERNGNNAVLYIDGTQDGTVSLTGVTLNNSTTLFGIGITYEGVNSLNGSIDEFRIIKGTALTADQIRQAYEYGLRSHPITIDFGATLQTSDLITSATDYNFSLTATTSGLSATTSGLYLGDKIIIKENLGGTEYSAQGTVNAINTSTGAITVPSPWDSGSTFPSGNGYSPNATVFKWQREYFDLNGSLSTHRDAITNLTIRPTNGAGGRTVYLDDFRYNTNYLTASSSSAITSGNNRYLQYRTIFTSTDTYVSPFLSAFNTLYTSLANSFPSLIGISGGGFMSF